jgi:hypothetical protein
VICPPPPPLLQCPVIGTACDLCARHPLTLLRTDHRCRRGCVISRRRRVHSRVGACGATKKLIYDDMNSCKTLHLQRRKARDMSLSQPNHMWHRRLFDQNGTQRFPSNRGEKGHTEAHMTAAATAGCQAAKKKRLRGKNNDT